MSIPGEYSKWLRMVDHYYSLPGNGAGGRLHVQIDDGNLEDCFFDDETIERARDQGDDLAVELLVLFASMSRTQRRKLCGKFWQGRAERWQQP